MTKKLIFTILGFLLLAVACRNEETFTNYENQKQEVISKSLWKEDMVYIKNVKMVFERDFDQNKFSAKFGLPFWEYAMSFGNFDETFLRVPIVKNRKVEKIMQVIRNKAKNKVYFSYTEDPNSIDFFQNLIFKNIKKEAKVDEVIRNPKNNETARTLSIENCTTRTFSFEVGCVEPYQNTENCPKMIEYRTVTTCTVTTLFIPDDDPAGWTGDNTGGSHDYPTGGSGSTNQNNSNPCVNLKERQNDPRYSEKFEHLSKKEILSMNRERGFFERLAPPANNLPSSFLQLDGQEGTTGLSLPNNLDGIIGLLHSHNDKDGVIRIFSPTDVRTFINHFLKQSNNYTGSYSNAYSTVVTSEGSYTLKYSKTTHPGGINFDTFTKWESWYVQKYEQLIRNDNLTQENVEKLFAQFMKEVVNIDGLELYKVTKDSSTKMEYDGKNNPVKTTNCP